MDRLQTTTINNLPKLWVDSETEKVSDRSLPSFKWWRTCECHLWPKWNSTHSWSKEHPQERVVFSSQLHRTWSSVGWYHFLPRCKKADDQKKCISKTQSIRFWTFIKVSVLIARCSSLLLFSLSASQTLFYHLPFLATFSSIRFLRFVSLFSQYNLYDWGLKNLS